jgi:hypothetical protein
MPIPHADVPAPDALNDAFLSVLPRIVAAAAFAFRRVRRPHRRADAVQEVVALAWRNFVRAARRGKDGRAFASLLADFAVRHVRAGRLLCGAGGGQDVLAPGARGRHGLVTSPLSDFIDGDGGHPALHELTDNTVTPPPDQAAFRLDFPRWRAGYGARDRALIDDLMAGERTGDVAGRYGLSAGRVAQKRAEFHADWLRFHGQEPDRQDRVSAGRSR